MHGPLRLGNRWRSLAQASGERPGLIRRLATPSSGRHGTRRPCVLVPHRQHSKPDAGAPFDGAQLRCRGRIRSGWSTLAYAARVMHIWPVQSVWLPLDRSQSEAYRQGHVLLYLWHVPLVQLLNWPRLPLCVRGACRLACCCRRRTVSLFANGLFADAALPLARLQTGALTVRGGGGDLASAVHYRNAVERWLLLYIYCRRRRRDVCALVIPWDGAVLHAYLLAQ